METLRVFLFWTLSGRLIHKMVEMNEKPSHSEQLFVVRIWSETETIPRAPCRGSVEHIPSGQKFYFTSLDDLSDFIALKTTARSQPSSTRKEPNQ